MSTSGEACFSRELLLQHFAEREAAKEAGYGCKAGSTPAWCPLVRQDPGDKASGAFYDHLRSALPVWHARALMGTGEHLTGAGPEPCASTSEARWAGAWHRAGPTRARLFLPNRQPASP